MEKKDKIYLNLDFLEKNQKDADSKINVSNDRHETIGADKDKSAKPQVSNEKTSTFKAHYTHKERIFAAIGYLGPLFVLTLVAKAKSNYCKFHALQSMLLLVVFFLQLILLVIIPVIGSLITCVIYVIYLIAIYQAYYGNLWRIPFIGKFAAKWSGQAITNNSQKEKNVWIGYFIFLLLVIFLTWIANTTNNSSTSSTNSSKNFYAEDGNGKYYNCSNYHSTKADSLKPLYTNKELEAESKNLDARGEAVKQSSTKIDNIKIDETDELAIAIYNAGIEEHNKKFETYKKDLEIYNEKINKFNSQIEVYNKYLETNCRKN